MAEQPGMPHKLTLNSRSHLAVSGVTEVVSFDEDTVVLRTEMGTLAVQGRQLRLIENEVINKLPPIQPKRGRWIKLDMHRGMADHKCTACKQECYVPTCMGEPMYAYCPNCGAKMEVTT